MKPVEDKMKKFPNIIHVVEEGDKDAAYLAVFTDGVQSLDEHGQEVAIYKLATVGRVVIEKTFHEPLRPAPTPRKKR